MGDFKRVNEPVGDEIDLRTVFNKIGAFFSGAAALFVNTIRFSIRKWLYLLPFLLGGALIGYLGHLFTKPYYNSTMIMMLSNIRNDFVKDHLYNLSELVAEDNFEVLSKSLNIPVEEARQIKGLSFANIDENKVADDSVLTGSPFRINLSLYNNQLFPKMERAINSYLEGNPYFSKNKTIRQKQVESMVAKLKEEISSIDSIKTVVVNPRGPSNGFVYGEATDPTNLYKEGMVMFEKRATLEAELQRVDDIQVVVGFTPRLKPSSPSKRKFIFFGVLVFYLIGISSIYYLEEKKLNTL